MNPRLEDDYELGPQLGQGATARVLRATHKGTQTPVAVKVFHRGPWSDPDVQRRAHQEFKTTLMLSHPNIVRIRETRLNEDPPAVVMDLVDGASLTEFQTRLPYVLPELSALVTIEILKGLAYAHEQGVVHRDLKPENILVGTDGRVYVADFGLAKITDASKATATGTILGSPDFMSPEQAQGGLASERSDVFSVGAVLYFLVTGTRPFRKSSPLATLAAVVGGQYEPATRRNPKLCAPLAAIIERALARDPRERYASANDFRVALEQHLSATGLGAEFFSLDGWIRSPSSVVFDGLDAVAGALSKSIEHDLTTERFDAATAKLSHLSQVAPESPDLARLMDSLAKARSARKRRILWLRASGVVFGVAALAATVAALVTDASEDELVAKSEADAVRPVVPVVVPEPAGLAAGAERGSDERAESSKEASAKSGAPVNSRPTEGSSQPREGTSRTRRETPRAARASNPEVVRFSVPADVDVYWNGRLVDATRPLRVPGAGMYKVKLVKPGRAPIEQTIKVVPGEPTYIRVK